MNSWNNDLPLPEDFDGLVRLFPLPNLVLFPNVIQALHIFEPRYCELLNEAMQADRLIAMATLKPGWESHIHGQPALERAVCIGRVVSHTPTDDGHHNILLLGRFRAKIIRELPMKALYRQAEVEALTDHYPDEDSHQEGDELRVRLFQLIKTCLPNVSFSGNSFSALAETQIPLGILTDVLSYAIPIPLAIKLQLLSEANVYHRCRLLVRCMEQLDKQKGDAEPGQAFLESHVIESIVQFPPPFSAN